MNRDEETRSQPADQPQPYEPPRAEDIDTGEQPLETAAAIFCPPPRGVEESERWH